MRRFMASILALALFICFVLPALAEDSVETKTIRIIGTSDLHGKFMPWDYALNAASPSGSMTQLLAPGVIYETGDLPALLEMDVRGDIGGVRELIRDYIVNVKGGTITPECDGNWRITGNDWDGDLHRKAVELLAEGRLTIPASEDGRTTNVKAITEEDVLGCLVEPGDVTA